MRSGAFREVYMQQTALSIISDKLPHGWTKQHIACQQTALSIISDKLPQGWTKQNIACQDIHCNNEFKWASFGGKCDLQKNDIQFLSNLKESIVLYKRGWVDTALDLM